MNRFGFWAVISLAAAAGLIAADGNSPRADGTTALHMAAYRDDVELASRLIREGANVKTANRYGVTPLSLACTNGSGAMVELLLKAGADANTALPGGETALMWAAAEGNAAVVETLIEAGADFHARLDSGFTPLLFAVREGRIDVVRALLKAGADVNESIKTTQTGKTKLASGNGAARTGVTALHLAVANAHYELAAYLLDAGADPNAAAPGWTPLHTVTWIRKSGGGDNDPSPEGSGTMTSLEFVKKLVAHGADVNARMTKRVHVGLTSLNTVGATTFFLAARTADAELMRFLVNLGADPLLPNADNSTPLMAAAGLGTRSPGEDAGTESEVVEAMKVALELGADINAVDNNGETAMHGAAYKNLPGAVELLAAKGAKIEIWNRKNKQGWTPLTIAEGHRFGNFKPSPVTIEALRRVMSAAGVVEPVVSAVR